VNDSELTFWQHLDVLRGGIIRCIVAILGFGIVAFCLKEPLFRVLFWAMDAEFPLWRLIGSAPAVSLINTGLAQQFITHVEVALVAGLVVASPYVIYELFRFVSPALYDNERRVVWPAVIGGYVMFVMGVALSYFLIFPFTLRFLAEYQVTTDVVNMIALESYVSTFFVLTLMLGLVFELPIICAILARLGLLSAAPMRRYRKHAIVVILILAAVITPTGDAFTLALVSLPIYLLYELSILLVRSIRKQ